MEKIFVNFSNHRSEYWDEEQISAAEKYGKIVDVPFPMVDPGCSEQDIRGLGLQCCDQIMAHHPSAVMCQGEFTLVYNVVRRLKENGITVVAACSERHAEEEGDVKKSIFRFVQFREYI